MSMISDPQQLLALLPDICTMSAPGTEQGKAGLMEPCENLMDLEADGPTARKNASAHDGGAAAPPNLSTKPQVRTPRVVNTAPLDNSAACCPMPYAWEPDLYVDLFPEECDPILCPAPPRRRAQQRPRFEPAVHIDDIDCFSELENSILIPPIQDLKELDVVCAVKYLKAGAMYTDEALIKYFYLCAKTTEAVQLNPERNWLWKPHLSSGYFKLLYNSLCELKLFGQVPPFPPRAYLRDYMRDYLTSLINKFKPLVRRSERLYQLLGVLVHLRIRLSEDSFESWLNSKDINIDPHLAEQVRQNKHALIGFFNIVDLGDASRRLRERGLQSALKYEEFYLKRFGSGSIESIYQMYTRIAGFLACHATPMAPIVLGRHGTWLEMFFFFFYYLYNHKIVPSTPAMLDLGSQGSYTSSCYLINPQTTNNKDTVAAISGDVSSILHKQGGIGLCLQSFNTAGIGAGWCGLLPALKVLDSLVAAYNTNSRRPTGACVYIEPWHTDVWAVLRMKGVLAGEESQRCDNIFSALWVPDLFFKRLIRHLAGEPNVEWTMFDGANSLALSTLHGEQFEALYEELEAKKLGLTVHIREIAYAIVRSATTTGSPFLMFKDAVNRHYIYDTQGDAISGSNLCTEIVHPSNSTSSGVCNLGSVNLAECVVDGEFDIARLRRYVRACVLMVNIMIDNSLQPTLACRRGNDELRSMGIGMQGLHTACLMLGLDMDSEMFKDLNKHIAEVMLLEAMTTSNALCVHGALPFAHFKKSMYSVGRFHWEGFPDAAPRYRKEWEVLRGKIITYGLRNSQFVALMPTVTSSQISEVSEGFAPLFTNLFSKVTRDGELLRPNTLLLREIHQTFTGNKLNAVLDKLDGAQWSIVHALGCLSPDHPLQRFKTAFEYDQTLLIDLCADRAPYVDHSQSMTLYVTEKADGTLPASELTHLLIHAYKRGLKTGMYYCKVRKATNNGVFGGDSNIICSACVL
ncbi:ribonucleotide reductase subunit 1 [Macropodid alphaherpesvirus 1]|uniref:Ribonucleoside-diphosphate reductase large subunit n=1 Tax=Macropodid alphaherpesvirus 1 TaxID=137443 RepID=A0A0Y0A4L5_9ALPH|nr:ribonucleotide reductase subunit 1 [Macropodid alphaherpesvirus 1]AMB16999.1 ribonucleotide reductase subunit 1 [Macropodid alphaherpesvirus 1]